MQHTKIGTWIAALVAVLLLLETVGCATMFRQATFEMIRVGVDDRDAVEAILGEPLEGAESSRMWCYRDLWTRRFAIIEFDDCGLVVRKYWLPDDDTPRDEPAP